MTTIALNAEIVEIKRDLAHYESLKHVPGVVEHIAYLEDKLAKAQEALKSAYEATDDEESSYSYVPVCRICKGEGTVDVEVKSMSGLGGFILQTQRCPYCKGSGADPERVITCEPELEPELAAAN